MKALLLILLILLVASSLVAQTRRPAPEFKEVLVLRIDGIRTRGTNATIAPSKLLFSDARGLRDSIDVKEIRTLYVRTGTRATTMAILGAATVGSVFLVRSLSADERDSQYKPVAAGTVAMSCFGGALIGALVGSSSEVWEIVPLLQE